MTMDLDPQSQKLKCKDDVRLYPDDFGGVSGIRGTGPSFFGITVPRYYQPLIKRLSKNGYVVGEDLFGSPYDWRFGAAQPDSFFDNLKSLVEKAYEQNGLSVTIVAHSIGCQLVHRFITERTTHEWRRKYINSATFIAPSWSGSGASFNTLWRIQAPILNLFKLTHLTDFAQSLGAVFIHFPHSLGYANTTLFVDPNGNNYSGSQLMDLLVTHQKVKPKHVLMAQNNLEFVRRWPMDPEVNVSILYNSGRKTALGLNLTNWRGFGKQIYGAGDGLVGSCVIDWVCQNWKSLVCRDMKSAKSRYVHKNLLFSSDTVDIIIEWVLGKDTVGKKNNVDVTWPQDL
jgi:lysophospholipase-3